MKEHIYTIPVVDGFKEMGCPFCNMKKKLETDSINYMLGPAYMEDNIRMETNAKGFCTTHFEKMYAEQNRLGLALMISTHLEKINSDLSKFNVSKSKRGLGRLGEQLALPTTSLFSKNKPESELVRYLRKINDSCFVCDRVENTFMRFIDTFFYLIKQDPTMLDYVKNSNGFCLSHFTLLLSYGEKSLGEKQYQEFYETIVKVETDCLKNLDGDVSWFVKKFDYRFKDEPWNDAQDSVERSLNYLK